MKRIHSGMLCCAVLLTAALGAARGTAYGPQQHRFGAGLYFGEPTGITAKGYVSSQWAISGVAAWSFRYKALTLIGAGTYDLFDLASRGAAARIPFYSGVALKVGFGQSGARKDQTLVGAHIPVGVAAQFARHPVELSFEVAPGVRLAPETAFDLYGGLGVRFYF